MANVRGIPTKLEAYVASRIVDLEISFVELGSFPTPKITYASRFVGIPGPRA
jgi:hypothetical protein